MKLIRKREYHIFRFYGAINSCLKAVKLGKNRIFAGQIFI